VPSEDVKKKELHAQKNRDNVEEDVKGEGRKNLKSKKKKIKRHGDHLPHSKNLYNLIENEYFF
jgi:hypothetical protein